MKRTSEVMAAVTYYPRKEVERWIVYNKEMANIMNFSPELADQDFSPFGHSTILNRSNMENIDPTLPCQQPITSDRPSVIYEVGQNFTSSTRHDGKVKDGYVHGHSHSIHPDVSSRYNNLSSSEFQPDRFKNMTNTSGLYEASGISPINKIEQPYTFTQEDNILSEVTKPTFAERGKESFSGSQTIGGVETIIQPEQSHVSFADRVKEFTNPNVQSTGSNVLKSEVTEVKVLENKLSTPNVVLKDLRPTTENVSEGTRASALPTLQERIRNVGTILSQKFKGTDSKDQNLGTTEPTQI